MQLLVNELAHYWRDVVTAVLDGMEVVVSHDGNSLLLVPVDPNFIAVVHSSDNDVIERPVT